MALRDEDRRVVRQKYAGRAWLSRIGADQFALRAINEALRHFRVYCFNKWRRHIA